MCEEVCQTLCLVSISCHDKFLQWENQGTPRRYCPVSVSALYSTKNLNFSLVTLDANMSETSFCQNLLVDVTIIPNKPRKKKERKRIHISCRNMLFILSSQIVMGEYMLHVSIMNLHRQEVRHLCLPASLTRQKKVKPVPIHDASHSQVLIHIHWHWGARQQS